MIRLLLLSSLLLISFPSLAQDEAMKERLAQWLKRYPEADTNKDGTLSLEEATAFREKMRSGEGDDRKGKKRVKVEPNHRDVAYGDHERHRFDLWIPEKANSDGLPFPLLVYFHGGGFVAGDKATFDPRAYLSEGIACASVNYRFVDGEETTSPVPFEDASRALQSIRHRAGEWNIDPGRVALSGGSAGAVITLWIGYHDDLADPDSDDPIARQSTRVTTLVPINGPTNLMPDWIIEHVGGSKQIHGSFAKLFGEPVTYPIPEGLRAKIAEASPWEYATADDPPTYLVYSGPLDETPLPETVTPGKSIHHPAFGRELKKKLDELGVENLFRHGFDPRGTPDIPDYLKSQFGMVE